MSSKNLGKERKWVGTRFMTSLVGHLIVKNKDEFRKYLFAENATLVSEQDYVSRVLKKF